MYQGTTPTLVLTLDDANLDGCTCYVTIKSGSKLVTKSGTDLDVSGNQISVMLSQDDTLGMTPGSVEIQARWIDSNGNAMASDVGKAKVSGVLYKQTIDYVEEG